MKQCKGCDEEIIVSHRKRINNKLYCDRCWDEITSLEWKECVNK